VPTIQVNRWIDGGHGANAFAHPTKLLISLVMPGLVPGIHVFAPTCKKDVDGRDKPGHDENCVRDLAIR